VYNNIGGVHLALFLRSRQEQELVQAERNFKKALEIDPRLFSACNGLGILYRKTGRKDEAIASWRNALVIKPDFDLALINLGITLLEEGRFGEALDCFLNYHEKFYYKIPLSEKQRVDRLIAEARAKL
jgi:Tfp pilus assembly protein PilF